MRTPEEEQKYLKQLLKNFQLMSKTPNHTFKKLRKYQAG